MQQCYLQGDLNDKKQDKAMLCHLACTGGEYYLVSSVSFC